jgi:hypothetical protein
MVLRILWRALALTNISHRVFYARYTKQRRTIRIAMQHAK